MKLIWGTFQKGCGILIEHNGEYYHELVYEDQNGQCYTEFGDRRVYESEVEKK